MKILVLGAGITGTALAARLHEAGHGVSLLARGARLVALREHGVQLAAESSLEIRRVPVAIVDHPDEDYDLIAVCVRTHQVEPVLDSLVNVGGDVLFLLNWAAGPEPLGAVIGRERVFLGFATEAGILDGSIVRYRPSSPATRLVTMPFGEADGRITPRLRQIVAVFRSAGVNAKAESHVDAWLKTHAAFEVPLGQAVKAAGGLEALAADREALRAMVERMQANLRALPGTPVPRGFGLLTVLPVAVLVAVFRRFLRSPVAASLGTTDPASAAELDFLSEQLRASPPTA